MIFGLIYIANNNPHTLILVKCNTATMRAEKTKLHSDSWKHSYISQNIS